MTSANRALIALCLFALPPLAGCTGLKPGNQRSASNPQGLTPIESGTNAPPPTSTSMKPAEDGGSGPRGGAADGGGGGDSGTMAGEPGGDASSAPEPCVLDYAALGNCQL